ncbi:nascent polypeptide-associated complex subunit beta-like [Prunus avium]|uniref:Nascent polypeptide-associated complex subunit beta-like n=1 Tax=Prunus avium TaxID=42229 RepID=A0A6P5SBI9_PRUAV|nr:nascent polypeptide-associated complex subunit beta-like [Prunus avium]
MNREKLMKMAGAVRTGGKGSMRRKEKAVHKTTTTDDKRLQSSIKRIGRERYPLNQVNIFMDDVVIQFINPRGEANMPDQNSDLSCKIFFPVYYQPLGAR